ncbi:MAG: sulfatase-like hydrolase/transferase [Nocardioidaceae bacterium]
MFLLSRRRLPALGFAAALVAGLALGPTASPAPVGQPAAAAVKPPSIVLILMDDFSTELLATMANGQRMKSQGASFTNSFVADSLCCVSRSALFTGQYPHLNGVYTNNPNSSTKPVGGWRAFKANGDMAKSFNVALKSAGYYTGFMGKYLNGYDVRDVDGQKVAPEIPTGWDSWRPIYGAGYKQWGWRYSASTAFTKFLGKRPLTRKDSDYSTNVMANWGVNFVKRHQADAKPYFLEISTYGTHSRTFGTAHHDDPLFPPAYADRPGRTKKSGNCGLLACPNMSVRNLPGFNDDRIDNTPVYADGTRAQAWQPNELVVNSDLENRRYRNRAQMAQSIDRLIGRVRATVGPNTYVVLTSDNGFHLGQHRLHYGKSTPYSSDAKVPMVVVGPGVTPGSRSQVIGNVDLAPTFETIAGLTPSAERAGSSFLPSLQDPAAPGNTYTFFEHTYSRTNPDTDPDFDSDLGGSSVTLPSYLAIRSKDALLVRWDLDKSSTGTDYAYELYDYTVNPYERTNVYARSRNLPWVQDMQAKLERYATCTPEQCWALAADAG